MEKTSGFVKKRQNRRKILWKNKGKMFALCNWKEYTIAVCVRAYKNRDEIGENKHESIYG